MGWTVRLGRANWLPIIVGVIMGVATVLSLYALVMDVAPSSTSEVSHNLQELVVHGENVEQGLGSMTRAMKHSGNGEELIWRRMKKKKKTKSAKKKKNKSAKKKKGGKGKKTNNKNKNEGNEERLEFENSKDMLDNYFPEGIDSLVEVDPEDWWLYDMLEVSFLRMNEERSCCEPNPLPPLTRDKFIVSRALANVGRTKFFCQLVEVDESVEEQFDDMPFSSDISIVAAAEQCHTVFNTHTDFGFVASHPFACSLSQGDGGSLDIRTDSEEAQNVAQTLLTYINRKCDTKLSHLAVKSISHQVTTGVMYVADIGVGPLEVEGLTVLMMGGSLEIDRKSKRTLRRACDEINSLLDSPIAEESADTAALLLNEGNDDMSGLWRDVDYSSDHPFGRTWRSALRVGGGSSRSHLRMLSDIPLFHVDPSHPMPVSYDARSEWPKCVNPSRVARQGECGSCWAVSQTRALANRLCIASKENLVIELSAQQLLDCAGGSNTCEGGDHAYAWQLSTRRNSTIDGLYEEWNYPYEGIVGACATDRVSESDALRYYGKCKSVRRAEGERAIMFAIIGGGPVTARITCYLDFSSYGDGVYYKRSKLASGAENTEVGHHAIMLIGWGETEVGVKYWVAENTWGSDWGENIQGESCKESGKSDCGYFRIVRGVDEVGIESDVVYGDACIDDSCETTMCNNDPPEVSGPIRASRIDVRYSECCVYRMTWNTTTPSLSTLAADTGRVESWDLPQTYTTQHEARFAPESTDRHHLFINNVDSEDNQRSQAFSLTPTCVNQRCIRGTCSKEGSCKCHEGYAGDACDRNTESGTTVDERCGSAKFADGDCQVRNFCGTTQNFEIELSRKDTNGQEVIAQYKVTTSAGAVLSFNEYGVTDITSCGLVS